jgi:ABC-type nickel/cobalt efflux system permease component RcnA
MSLLSAALLGLGLGVKHAFEADHVAAVCALVARRGTVARAARAGALWGLGHGAVIIVAGTALVLLGARVPGPLAAALDAAVAVMLVGLGVSALRRTPQDHDHEHAHSHDHDHDHEPRGATRRPILIGLVHGASGTAALTLLVASTIPGRAEALAFITLFGLASIVGMAAAAAVLAWPLRKAAEHAPVVARGLRGMAGVGSIAAGLMVAWIALYAAKIN